MVPTVAMYNALLRRVQSAASTVDSSPRDVVQDGWHQ